MTIDKETQCSRVDQLSIETPSTPLRPFYFLPLLISLSLSPSLASYYYYYIIYKWERKPMSGCCIHTHFHWQKARRGRTNQVLVTEATTNGWRQWDRHRMTVAAAAAAVSFSFSIKSFMLCVVGYSLVSCPSFLDQISRSDSTYLDNRIHFTQQKAFTCQTSLCCQSFYRQLDKSRTVTFIFIGARVYSQFFITSKFKWINRPRERRNVALFLL